MKLSLSSKTVRLSVLIFVVVMCAAGIGMRLYRINKMDFIYYDEGYYLNFNRYFYDFLVAQFPDNFYDMFQALWFWLRLSLATGKAFWFMMADARVFFGAYQAWFFPRILAALSGIATLGLVYRFGMRYFKSRRTAVLSMVLLAIMPSHVFYSRIAMQETFSTLCFLTGFYLYIFPRKFSYRTILAGFAFSAAFFTNYRLITLPVHIALCEMILSVNEKRLPDFRKYIWAVLSFFFFVFMIGNIDHGNNTKVVFAWMFYQSSLAKEQFDWINFLSFPYYIFRLDNFFFGLALFANFYLVLFRKWVKLVPFGIVCLHIFIYSFAGEKGARYLCVVMPFIVMAVAHFLVYVWEHRNDRFSKVALFVVGALMIGGMLVKSYKITASRSDYETAMDFLKKKDPNVKVISTQNYVLNLFTPDREQVVAFPYKFREFTQYYAQGYRYLIVGPQAYVSWVKDMKRFSPELFDFLGFIVKTAPPIKVYPHFNDIILERFVFDHNENLRRSMKFLKENKDGRYGQLKIYDVGQILFMIDRIIGLNNIKLNPEYQADRPYLKYGR